jgi:hypothetical protein
MAYEDMSPLSKVTNDYLFTCSSEELMAEIQLFRKALQYCYNQRGDDNCWMDYRHLLMRFLPGYDPAKDDVVLDVDQSKNCDSFRRCWQEKKNWDCLGGDKGKTVPARSIGTLDCLEMVNSDTKLGFGVDR